MRLLERSKNGLFNAPIDFTSRDTIPRYAILSHTWALDNDEEVTFDDLVRGTGEAKSGYEKLRFCDRQAQQDELEYFWIDTCCIDKGNKAELSLAIRSMFRWYRNATRCYVFLSDVSGSPSGFSEGEDEEAKLSQWESDFRKSRWFTRGWTLQELLAPDPVQFFSKEGQKLGDKMSLVQEIQLATGIPHSALQGALLSEFSVNERISWNEHRTTKLPVDRAYSLMGILGVSMPPFDGEGPAEALTRLTSEVDKQTKCLRDLYITDPIDDKKRIEETKGGLLEDSYRWVLENPGFQQWRKGSQSQLLWIKGDPGKGKTMLLCGIINELQQSMAKTSLLSYFFCQATDSRINSAIAVLRGLLYMLINQQPLLASHIYKKYDRAGKTMFEDANAWEALTGILAEVLRDPNLTTTYLIVDALDECIVDLPKLLSFIAEHSSISASPRTKWIISSRNWPDIQERLDTAGHKVRLSLELNAQSVATAVNIFIEQKVSQLTQQKKYDESTRATVLKHLVSNADNTFLWVALVCEDLKSTPKRNVLKRLASFPPGLDSLYKRMMQHVSESDDAEICMRVLASTAILYRPVAIYELVALVKQLEEFVDDLDSVREIISLCGSFLTLRENIVYFVHQSAKDFIFTGAFAKVFPEGSEDAHRIIFSRSLTILHNILHRDIYNLGTPGIAIEDVTQPKLNTLLILRYPCLYWVDHLCDSDPKPSANHSLQIGGAVDVFLKDKYLYWLEALSLCKSIAKGILSVAKLRSLVQSMQNADGFIKFVQDAWRFIMYHKLAIENYPLQTYASALLFSPTDSLIRKQFQHEEPTWITIEPAMSDGWSAGLQTLEGHSGTVWSVAFSHDSTRIASGSGDGTIKLWNVNSGECLQTLVHGDLVMCVTFSPDSARLVSASSNKIIKIWDTNEGMCLHTLELHDGYTSIAFSYDLTRVTAPSDVSAVKIFDLNSGNPIQTLEDHSHPVQCVAFSHDSTLLASASGDKTIKIWDVDSGECLTTINHDVVDFWSLSFSPDSTKLISTSNRERMHMWDVSSGMWRKSFRDPDNVDRATMPGTFSHDSARLAAGSGESSIRVWDVNSGDCSQTFKGHSDLVISVVFSHDSTLLASGSEDHTVKIWDANNEESFGVKRSEKCESLVLSPDSKLLAMMFRSRPYIDISDVNSGAFMHRFDTGTVAESIGFSPNSRWLAVGAESGGIKVWDVSNGECVQTFDGGAALSTITFSPSSTQLASPPWNAHIKIWDIDSGKCLETFKGYGGAIGFVAFSSDSALLASATWKRFVNIWEVDSGKLRRDLASLDDRVESLAFSHDLTLVASALLDHTVKIWNIDSGDCLITLNVRTSLYKLSFDSTGQKLDTEIGTIDISISSSTNMVGNATDLREAVYEGMGISSNREWIMSGSKKLLWLPSEYRPSDSSISRNMILIGDGSGRLWIYRADMDGC